MVLERLRRSSAQDDEQIDVEDASASDAEDESAAADVEAESSDDAAAESGGSRLGTLKKGLGVAVAAATVALTVRRFRRRGGE